MHGLTLTLTLTVFLAACHGSPSNTVELAGTVVHLAKDGIWTIHGDDGQLYQPSDFPIAYSKDGLRVRALLARHAYFSVEQVGVMVDVVDLVQLPCNAAACMPAPVAWLYVLGSNAGDMSLTTVSNVTGPVGAPEPAASCTPVPAFYDPSLKLATCTFVGAVAGAYEADLSAPGFGTEHVVIEVPARQPAVGECCPQGYVTQVQQQYLTSLP